MVHDIDTCILGGNTSAQVVDKDIDVERRQLLTPRIVERVSGERMEDWRAFETQVDRPVDVDDLGICARLRTATEVQDPASH